MLLDLASQLVTQVRFDFGVSLLTVQGTVLRLQSDFMLQIPGRGDHHVEIDRLSRSAALLVELFGESMANASAHADGTLELLFASGTRITVAPDELDESWSLNAGSGELLVSLPGGGMSVLR